MKRNGYFTFHTIIHIAGVHSAISDAVCVGSAVKIIIYKKFNKQKYVKKLEFSPRVGTIAHR